MDSINSYASTSSYDLLQKRQELFAKIDTDSDGQFSLEEFEAAKPADAPADGPTSAEIFSEMDADGDGYISEDEFASAAPPPPPPPPGGAGSLFDEETLSALLAALEEYSNSAQAREESDSESTIATTSAETSDEDDITEQDLLELLQEELDKMRYSVHHQAQNAYGDAGLLTGLMASQAQASVTL